MPFKHTFFPWRIIWLIVCPVVFVQFFINNLIKKLFPSCVNLHSERFFREARPRFSVPWRMRWNIILNHTTCWRDLKSVLGAHAREKSLGTRLFHMSFLAVEVLYQKEIKYFGYFFTHQTQLCINFEQNRWFELYDLLPGFLVDTLLTFGLFLTFLDFEKTKAVHDL